MDTPMTDDSHFKRILITVLFVLLAAISFGLIRVLPNQGFEPAYGAQQQVKMMGFSFCHRAPPFESYEIMPALCLACLCRGLPAFPREYRSRLRDKTQLLVPTEPVGPSPLLDNVTIGDPAQG